MLKALSCLFFLLMACSLSQFGWKQETPAKPLSKSEMREDFDPLTLEDDDIVIAPKDTSQTAKTAVAPVSWMIEEKPAVNMDGYRVQLLMTKSEAAAHEAKQKAIFKFDDKIYLIFEAPYYKIRIGDFESKKDADQIRDDALAKGFPDAWVVRTQIEKSSDSP